MVHYTYKDIGVDIDAWRKEQEEKAANDPPDEWGYTRAMVNEALGNNMEMHPTHELALLRYAWKPDGVRTIDDGRPWKPLKYYPTGNKSKWSAIEWKWNTWWSLWNDFVPAPWHGNPGNPFPTIEMRDRVALELPAILMPNIKKVFRTYRKQGGFKAKAHWTLMANETKDWRVKRNVHIAEAMGIGQRFDQAKLQQAWSEYIRVNGWDKAKVSLEFVSVTDAQMPGAQEAFVHVKEKETMDREQLLKMWVYLTPTKTYLAGLFQFGHFDGTSIFNFIKGLVHVYFGGEVYKNRSHGDAPLVTVDNDLCKKRFGFLFALWVAYKESIATALIKVVETMGSPGFSPALTAIPPQAARCRSYTPIETKAWLSGVKASKGRPFEWMVRSLGAAIKKKTSNFAGEQHAWFLIPISWQQRLYKPELPKRLVGDWLSIRTSYLDLTKLSIDEPGYMQTLHDELGSETKKISALSRHQILRDVVLDDKTFKPNMHRSFWFNNYGTRDIDERARDAEYFWGPTKVMPLGLIVNTITLNGRTSVTLQSSFMKKGDAELETVLDQLSSDIRCVSVGLAEDKSFGVPLD
jgi:hypothetical protein